jgi:hypothetical protein
MKFKKPFFVKYVRNVCTKIIKARIRNRTNLVRICNTAYIGHQALEKGQIWRQNVHLVLVWPNSILKTDIFSKIYKILCTTKYVY